MDITLDIIKQDLQAYKCMTEESTRNTTSNNFQILGKQKFVIVLVESTYTVLLKVLWKYCKYKGKNLTASVKKGPD